MPQTVTVTGVNDNQSGSVPYQVVFAPAVSTRHELQRADAGGVSLTNLPNEVQNIQVTNLAVNPSTGLNQGSSLTITWNDSNTGNLPATAAWDDQVVITNTTTGDTLDDGTRSHRSRRRRRPRSGGRRWPSSMPSPCPPAPTASATCKITVTANVNHSAFESGNEPDQCEPADLREWR